jgi:hypothetical protein
MCGFINKTFNVIPSCNNAQVVLNQNYEIRLITSPSSYQILKQFDQGFIVTYNDTMNVYYKYIFYNSVYNLLNNQDICDNKATSSLDVQFIKINLFTLNLITLVEYTFYHDSQDTLCGKYFYLNDEYDNAYFNYSFYIYTCPCYTDNTLFFSSCCECIPYQYNYFSNSSFYNGTINTQFNRNQYDFNLFIIIMGPILGVEIIIFSILSIKRCCLSDKINL